MHALPQDPGDTMASSRKFVIYAALIGNMLIAITKFMAAFITSSSAMFSEGIHSAVDTGNQMLLLYGLRQSKKPADERFPFGHGKEIYFWSFVVASSSLRSAQVSRSMRVFTVYTTPDRLKISWLIILC